LSEHQASGPIFDFQLEDIWPILLKQRAVIGLFMTTILVSTMVFGLIKTKQYTANVLIHLSPRSGQEFNVNEVMDFNTRGYYELQQFYRTQIQIVESRSVREKVLRRYLELGYDDLDLESGVNRLSNITTVVPLEQSQLINITVTHDVPEQASILANLTAEVYEENNLELRTGKSHAARVWLENQRELYKVSSIDARDALFDFKMSHDIVDVEEHLTTLSARTDALNRSFGDVTTRRVLQQTNVERFDALLDQGSYAELAQMLDSPQLISLATRYADVLSNDASLAATYGDKHPRRIQLEAERKRIEELIQFEVTKMVDSERAQLDVVLAEERNLQSEINGVKQEALEYQRLRAEFDTLKEFFEQQHDFLANISRRLEEVQLTAQTQFNNVSIIDKALIPKSPSSPNLPMSMAVAFFVGLVGGVGLAVVREYIDDTISSQLDVSAYLKVPFLGLVPKLPEDTTPLESDLYTHNNPRSTVAEAVRSLRAILEMSPSGSAPRRILVTSSVAREGKTSTTLRLGVAYAQMGRKVVVIDADLRRPRLHKVFGEDNAIGLTSYLMGAANSEEISTATAVPNLRVIFSGSSTDTPAELLASEKMPLLLDELQEQFDVVIVDTPPSVALSDAVTLSRYVDGILLVVKEQSVSRAVVKQTIETFKQVDAKILGVVLNNVDLQRSGSKYKYYYAYRDYYSTYHPAALEGDKAAK
jgi:capsular exopolysaccharide synthesis family protein